MVVVLNSRCQIRFHFWSKTPKKRRLAARQRYQKRFQTLLTKNTPKERLPANLEFINAIPPKSTTFAQNHSGHESGFHHRPLSRFFAPRFCFSNPKSRPPRRRRWHTYY
jgi:hypothetical protein